MKILNKVLGVLIWLSPFGVFIIAERLVTFFVDLEDKINPYYKNVRIFFFAFWFLLVLIFLALYFFGYSVTVLEILGQFTNL